MKDLTEIAKEIRSATNEGIISGQLQARKAMDEDTPYNRELFLEHVAVFRAIRAIVDAEFDLKGREF